MNICEKYRKIIQKTELYIKPISLITSFRTQFKRKLLLSLKMNDPLDLLLEGLATQNALDMIENAEYQAPPRSTQSKSVI